MRPNILPYLAATLYLLLLLPCNAQGLGDTAYVNELNDGLIAYAGEDYALALRLLEPLANRDMSLAQLFVGRLFAKKLGTPQNCELAVTWLTRAARNGNADAASDLATFSEQGHCVSHSTSQALKWYEVAAANGDQYARIPLARFISGAAMLHPIYQRPSSGLIVLRCSTMRRRTIILGRCTQQDRAFRRI